MDKVYSTLEQSQGTGEILNDEKYDWRTKKLKNLAVAPHITNCSESRKEQFECCCTRLEFAHDGHGKIKLIRSNNCKHPLCSTCNGRRSMKYFHEVRQVAELAVEKNPSVRFLMLTLTVPNISASELSETLTHLLNSFQRLIQRSEFKKAIKGWFRSLEITYNADRDDYHPHFHCLLMVNNSYFKGKQYITQARWLELWQEATRQSEITSVDIRRVKSNPKRNNTPIEAAAAEVAKYVTKEGDYVYRLSKDEYGAKPDVIDTLCHALKKRRLVAFGGLLKAYRQEIGLDTKEDDLVNVGDERDEEELFIPVGIRLFYWMGSQKNYISR